MCYSENWGFSLRLWGCGAQPREKFYDERAFLGDFCTPQDLSQLVGKVLER